MGYYTRHTAITKFSDEELEQLSDISGYDFSELNTGTDGEKWYEGYEQLCKFSSDHPNRLFVLDCVGEDGEHWRTFHKNGLGYFENIGTVWEDFDPDKLSDEKEGYSHGLKDGLLETLNMANTITEKLTGRELAYVREHGI